jgi:hypothetical protein
MNSYLESKLFGVFLLFFCFSSQAQEGRETAKEHKHSVGITICPFNMCIWQYPGYQFHPDDQDSRFEYAYHPIGYFPLSIRYTYHLNYAIGIETGIGYSVEKNTLQRVKFTDENNDNRVKAISYREDLAQLPLSFVFYPYTKDRFEQSKAVFFIKIGVSCDFIMHDRTVTTNSRNIDFHATTPPGGWDYDTHYETAGNATNKLRFNRISPLLAIGQTINPTGKFSVYYNFATLQFAPLFQERNTVEYFRNIRNGVFTFGMNYNF